MIDQEILRELCKRVYFEQVIAFYSVSEIAKMIEQNRHNTYKSVKRLVKEGVLLENPICRGKSYQLNREFYNKNFGKNNGRIMAED